MLDEEMIEQKPGKSDRRERRLYATKRGQQLAERLMEPQLLRIQKALERSGTESEQISRQFFYHMINSTDHKAVMELFSHSRS